jgi:hypothetical protein
MKALDKRQTGRRDGDTGAYFTVHNRVVLPHTFCGGILLPQKQFGELFLEKCTSF